MLLKMDRSAHLQCKEQWVAFLPHKETDLTSFQEIHYIPFLLLALTRWNGIMNFLTPFDLSHSFFKTVEE